VIEVTNMTNLKDGMVQLVGQNAAARVAVLAGELVHATPDEKEAILAGLDFEGWLAETCEQCLDRPGMLR